MSLELVIFDVDGLLLNTERVWQNVWCDVAESYGISEWTQESFLHVVGRTGIAVRALQRNFLILHDKQALKDWKVSWKSKRVSMKFWTTLK